MSFGLFKTGETKPQGRQWGDENEQGCGKGERFFHSAQRTEASRGDQQEEDSVGDVQNDTAGLK